TEDSISLAWDPPENAVSIPVDQYEVIREIPRLPDESFSVAEAAFTDTGLDPDTEYRYRVRAISIDGIEGADVDLVASTADAQVESPGSVLDLRLVNATKDSISLAWDPPVNADAASVDRYEVVREVPRLPDQSYSVAEAAFTDTRLEADSQYQYRVRAISVDGVEGPAVDLAASTLKPTAETESVTPGAVRNLRADSRQNSIVLTWDPPANAHVIPIDRYKVSRLIALRPDEAFFVSEPEFIDKGLAAGSEYRYRVRAIGLNGEAGAEIDLVASTSEPARDPDSEVPDPVRNLTASAITNNSITLTWDPPANAEAASVIRYEVARDVRLLPDERFSVAETAFTDTQLGADSQYRYRVRAINRNGSAGQSVDLIATTLAS
ncbi:MAG: fibronectin type III domain-containing protein, partial [Chloroflexota bacterium]|nr:fibronectin type III domain-containing protein [Chloroflexota bacterium]